MATKTNTKIKYKNSEYGYYRITRTIGHEIKDGKKVPIKKQFVGTSKTNAEKKYEAWKDKQKELKEKNILESNKPLLELADFYCENILSINQRYAKSTIEMYKFGYRKLKEKDTTGLLAKPVNYITSNDIQICYNRLDIPKSTMKAINSFLSSFFSWSVLNNYCTDILSPVIIPIKRYTKRKDGIVIWYDNELKQIFNCIGNNRLRFMIYLAIYSGARISELLGLKYSDIGETINIKRQCYCGEIKKPKYNSCREIPTHRVIAKELQRHREWHLKEMERKNYKTDYIFTTSTGKLFDVGNIRKRLVKFYNANSIPFKSFHTYRTTFCTNLCKAQVPLQVASALMGHKSVDVTASVYTFIDKEEKNNAINKLMDL